MPSIRFDRFYRYTELSTILEAFAAERPDLVSIESIGKSHEGRDIRVLTVTNTKTGPAAEKPAFWVDGNIHSTEVAGSSACLYLLQTLVTGYGDDAEITRALDTRAFYVCPRINPDGAEWALADKPRWVRSSTRAWPYEDEEIEGLTVEDVDGDGRILQMRIADPNGLWKDHPEEPGLMIRRDPVETGGTYYRVLPEGTYEGWDGFTLRVKKRKQGIDLNRNFPANWRQEFEQLGAGPYPTSEPEARALAEFFARHRNVTGGVSFHTWSGVLLRPFDHLPDTGDARRGSVALPEGRQEGHRAHRLSGDRRLPRVSLPPEGGDRRLVRLDLRASRNIQLGRRDLESDARGGHRELSVHRVVPRSPGER
jgi:murein tripeptide amidase MpaA